jgi:hypothetical protein
MMLNSGLIPIHNGFDELFKILSVMHYVILPQGRVVVGVLRSAKTTTYSNWCLGYRTGIVKNNGLNYSKSLSVVVIPHHGVNKAWLGLAIVQRMTSLLDYPVMFILSLEKVPLS